MVLSVAAGFLVDSSESAGFVNVITVRTAVVVQVARLVVEHDLVRLHDRFGLPQASAAGIGRL